MLRSNGSIIMSVPTARSISLPDNYFQTADLFAWTAVIVLLSVLFEGLFLRGVDALTERWCA